MTKIIGIDLGTTNSCVAVMEGGEPTVIPSSEGARLIPSVVAVNPKNGERTVGQVARRQAVMNPENTIFSVKRFMGRKFSDAEVQKALKVVPYKVSAAPNGDVRVTMGGKDYSPPEVSAMILQKIKADAEAYLGETITQAVITVPAYFNDSQRQATKDAGRIAGLEVLRIINEPTASSLAYGLDKKKDETIAVYDLGGGTFDISILEVGDGVMQVRATGGDTFLGGEDFDQRIIDFLVEDFMKSNNIDLSQDRMARQRLKEAAEKAKCDLSTTDSTEIVLPFISADASGPKHLSTTLTRKQYEGMTQDLLSRTEEPCRRCLADAGLKADQIDDGSLVGGQTRAPQVVEIVQRVFGRKANRSINPDECVAMGAAIQTGIMEGEVKSLVLLDVTPYTLGIETMNGTFTPIIDRNSAIPTRRSRIFTTVADNQTSVELHVLQGESDMSAYNRSLARFDLTNIPPAPRGLPQIEVGFEIDSDGIVSVSALDQATGRSQSLVIHPASGINERELERLVGETKLRQVNEKETKEKEKLLQQVSGLVANSQRTLTLLERKLSAEEKTKIQTAIMDTQRLKIDDTISTLQRSLREMEEIAQILSSAMLRA